MKLQKCIDIASRAEDIWPLLVEPENIMRWCRYATKVQTTGEQNSGLGCTFYLEERAAGRLLKLHFVITEWEVNRLFGFKMISGNLVKCYQQRYTLEPHRRGTKLTLVEDVTLPLGFMGRAAGFFRKPISEARVNRMLAQLKDLGESNSSL